MVHLATDVHDQDWFAYYAKFRYFSSQLVRVGCEPKLMEHKEPREKAIVLIHGLTDSPYFMKAIADYFFAELGYNVYLPLLHCHGLKQPKGMEGVKLEEWKANIDFAIEVAAAKAKEISIGGLSTGGALSLAMSVKNPKINGAVYLFSAALDLGGGPLGFKGEVRERLLRTFLADTLDNNRESMIGKHPYRYARMDIDGAHELARLLQEIDTLIKQYTPHHPFPKRIFAAHSESDSTATIQGIETLQRIATPALFTFFRIPRSLAVSHASVVLKEPLYTRNALQGEEPLEKANPRFQEMVEAIGALHRHIH